MKEFNIKATCEELARSNERSNLNLFGGAVKEWTEEIVIKYEQEVEMSESKPREFWGGVKVATGEIVKMIEYEKYLALQKELEAVKQEYRQYIHNQYIEHSKSQKELEAAKKQIEEMKGAGQLD